MEKKDIIYTKVWKINKQLVVAETIEKAIEVYKSHLDFPYNEITSIQSVTDGGLISDNSALMWNPEVNDDIKNPESYPEEKESEKK